MFPLLHMFNVKSPDLEPHGFTGITLNKIESAYRNDPNCQKHLISKLVCMSTMKLFRYCSTC